MTLLYKQHAKADSPEMREGRFGPLTGPIFVGRPSFTLERLGGAFCHLKITARGQARRSVGSCYTLGRFWPPAPLPEQFGQVRTGRRLGRASLALA